MGKGGGRDEADRWLSGVRLTKRHALSWRIPSPVPVQLLPMPLTAWPMTAKLEGDESAMGSRADLSVFGSADLLELSVGVAEEVPDL